MKKNLIIGLLIITAVFSVWHIYKTFSPKITDSVTNPQESKPENLNTDDAFTSTTTTTEGQESIKTTPQEDFMHFSQLPAEVKEAIIKSTQNRYTQTFVAVSIVPGHDGLQYTYRPGYPKEPAKEFTGIEDTDNSWVFIKKNNVLSLSSVELDGKLSV